MKKYNFKLKHKAETIVKMIQWGGITILFSIIGGILISAATYLYSLLSGILLRNAVMISQSEVQKSFADFLIPMIFVTLLALLCRFLGHRLNTYGSYHIFSKQYEQVVTHCLKVKETYAQKRHTGDVMTQLTYDLEELDYFYNKGLRNEVLSPVVQGIMAISTVAWVDWKLVFVSLGIGIVSWLFTIRFTPIIHKTNEQIRNKNDKLTESLLEIMRGTATIRVGGIEDTIINQYNHKVKEKMEIEWCNQKAKNKVLAGSDLFLNVSMIVFLIFGMLLSYKGKINLADIMIAIPMQNMITRMVINMTPALNYLSGVSIIGQRVISTFECPLEEQRTDKNLAIPKLNKSIISFENVSFSYDSIQNILKNCSFCIKNNGLIAVVAGSGGGKSTILKLIAGFYDEYEGRITIEGINFFDCSLETWRSKMVYLEQEAPLFDLSIRENIALGLQKDGEMPREEEIIEAAKKANAHEFILNMPDGYDTNVGEMGNLISGGQRQRIAIARAFLSKASIVLLDEPTAALDTENEMSVNIAIKNLAVYKTVIITSHRLSTIRNSDLILVLDEGHIIESGNHDELINKQGKYYKMTLFQKV